MDGGPRGFKPQLLVSIDVFGSVDAAVQHENGTRRFPRQIDQFCQDQTRRFFSASRNTWPLTLKAVTIRISSERIAAARKPVRCCASSRAKISSVARPTVMISGLVLDRSVGYQSAKVIAEDAVRVEPSIGLYGNFFQQISAGEILAEKGK